MSYHLLCELIFCWSHLLCELRVNEAEAEMPLMATLKEYGDQSQGVGDKLVLIIQKVRKIPRFMARNT